MPSIDLSDLTPQTASPLSESDSDKATERPRHRKTGLDELPTSDGLAGIVAARTALSHVDGHRGELIIAGEPVGAFAPKWSFDETVAHLLGVDEASQRLRAHRRLTAATLEILDRCRDRDPMDALRIGVGTLQPEGDDRTEQALSLLGKIPTVVATHHRLSRGLDAGTPNQDVGTARAMIEQIEGGPVGDARVRALDTYLNTVCDHGMNASTFTARVIASTGSDLVSSLTGAIGALKGPLHGGAPGPALDMVFEIGSVDRAEPILRAKLDAGERLMGFGHRIYRVRDPRADVLGAAARLLAAAGEQHELFELAEGIEAVALRLLAEYKPERKLDTNVEFYTALLLHGIGFGNRLFTPTFAVGRSLGWVAHCFEQIDHGRLIRPDSVYIGRRP